MEDYVLHYGVKGMRWGVRRYQNYDGTRIHPGDQVLSKGRKLVRYTADKNERKGTAGKYASTTRMDTYVYRQDAINNKLGFKSHKEIWALNIDTISDAKVRSGRSAVKDLIDEVGDSKLVDAYNTLDKSGFYDSSKSSREKHEMWSKSNELSSARKFVASSMSKYVKQNKNQILKKYADKGYDAIVDPEDYSWNYEMPLILLNSNKFKETSRSRVENENRWKDKK